MIYICAYLRECFIVHIYIAVVLLCSDVELVGIHGDHCDMHSSRRVYWNRNHTTTRLGSLRYVEVMEESWTARIFAEKEMVESRG